MSEIEPSQAKIRFETFWVQGTTSDLVRYLNNRYSSKEYRVVYIAPCTIIERDIEDNGYNVIIERKSHDKPSKPPVE